MAARQGEAGGGGGREKLDLEVGVVAERLQAVRLQIARTQVAVAQPQAPGALDEHVAGGLQREDSV